MRKRSLPNAQVLWRRHVELVLCVMTGALRRLLRHTAPPDDEEDLDRVLYMRAKEEFIALPADSRPMGFNLVSKSENAPRDDTDLEKGWVRKRPDFKWRLTDNLASMPRDLTMDFDIESKRLGKPTSQSWVLNREYVENGICRFLRSSHGYGNGVSAGGMIGYIQSMDPAEVLKEVNQYIRNSSSEGLPGLSSGAGDSTASRITEMRQSLKRREVSPCAFTLRHLWVDLRACLKSL